MSLVYVVAKVKSLFLIILAVFKRALCCFRKRRRTSNCESEILTTIGIVPAYGNSAGDVRNKPDEDSWNTWEDKPVTIQDHIERFRQQRSIMKEMPPEPTPDYFQDMTPRLTRQPKVLIPTDSNTPSSPVSRLAVNNDIPITSELEVWDEDQNGWEDDGENAMELLREKRRQERREHLERGGQTKKYEQKPVALGAKRSGA